jgi:hypothetical protein
MPTARGTIEVEFTDETYDDRDRIQLNRRRLRKVFHGDVVGESVGEFLMAVGQDGSAACVGIDRVDATVAGAPGSFILVHSATRSAAETPARIVVLADTGTGDLRGLRGELAITVAADGSHTYAFDYEFERA